MIYPIVFDPEPILHQPSANLLPAEVISRSMQKFIKDMVETMYVKDGVGLAAIQVGQALQLCVIAKQYNTYNQEDLCLINPTWDKLTKHFNQEDEGCLSVPGLYGKVKRYSAITVKALDKKGEPIQFVAEKFFARIIQHEVDHLQGHLYLEKAKNIYRANPEVL